MPAAFTAFTGIPTTSTWSPISLENWSYLPSPEDAILQKIRWFERSGRVSDRQWSDVVGMLNAQGKRIDFAYMRDWAVKLGLSELLERAIGAASSG